MHNNATLPLSLSSTALLRSAAVRLPPLAVDGAPRCCCHPWCTKKEDAVLLFRSFTALCCCLLLAHLLLTLFSKLFSRLAADTAIAAEDGDAAAVEDHHDVGDDCLDAQWAPPDDAAGGTMAFWFGESFASVDDGVVLAGEATDLLAVELEVPCFEPKDTDDSPAPAPEELATDEDLKKKLDPVEEGEGHKEGFGTAWSLAAESTSKSSVEWRSSTITTYKDSSETEAALFSSSSRRSSANWEAYAMFRRYDEDMLYFHRIGSEKLTEAESFRSIQHKPRSISERITHRFTARAPAAPPAPVAGELESAYVAQVCLTWEALGWNYSRFSRRRGDCGCPARVAQEFQEFQVLLQRFIETEPFERGRRPEIYARMKLRSPRLLIVPEYRDSDGDDDEDDLISPSQFQSILQDGIKTFMSFLKADRPSTGERLRGAAAVVIKKKRPSNVDPSMVAFLRSTNKKKKARLKELAAAAARRRCLRGAAASAGRLTEQEEFDILVALVDMKVVARVLRSPSAAMTEAQLRWCEEKMTKIRLAGGRVVRDASPVLFPGGHGD